MSIKPIVVILGGGAGLGLFPLTKNRSKPAVPIGGKFRLIDVPISNCLRSELYHIFILTQFNSGSLNRHIISSFQMPPFIDSFVEVRAAAITNENPNWYQGTADAVRQNLAAIRGAAEIMDTNYVLILSGDHLYNMDYRQILNYHESKGSEITVSVATVPQDRVSGLGIIQIDEEHRITRFAEKPSDEIVIRSFRQPGSTATEQRPYLGSMGIYVFNLQVLEELLSLCADCNEFGREVLPNALGRYTMFAYLFGGYWENVGTIRYLYEANLNMTGESPIFDFFPEPGRMNQFFTRGRSLPAAKINRARLKDSLVAEGAIIDDDARIVHSVVGMRSMIGAGVQLEDSVVFGCDYYQSIENRLDVFQRGEVPLGIGEGSILRGCIVDKNAHIGRNVVLENKQKIQHADGEKYFIRDGIVVIPKNVVIEDNFRLEL